MLKMFSKNTVKGSLKLHYIILAPPPNVLPKEFELILSYGLD